MRPKAITILLLLPIATCLAGTSEAAVIGQSLQRKMVDATPTDTLAVIVEMADRVDPSRYTAGRNSAPALIAALRERASATQADLLRFLSEQPTASAVKSFWISNSIALHAPRALVEQLAGFPEIQSIDFDVPVRFESSDQSLESTESVEWNISKIRADQVWSSCGLTGDGVLIGIMDTGFDPNHSAFQGKCRGGSNSWIDLVNGQPTPYDDNGHGTHVLGTAVGGDGPGPSTDDIGVAYGAHFIAAKILDSANRFSSTSIVVAGAQWMLDPDNNPATNDFPDVINNSWFFDSVVETGFHSAAAAWRSAGIIPIFCIGNIGPASGSAQPPGSYDNTIGVGATDENDVIATFSGRGPSPIGSEFPSDRRKPDLCAPGVAIRSSVPGGSFGLKSGTSMATPLVTGTVAMMLEGNPSLDYDAIRSHLIDNVVDLAHPVMTTTMVMEGSTVSRAQRLQSRPCLSMLQGQRHDYGSHRTRRSGTSRCHTSPIQGRIQY